MSPTRIHSQLYKPLSKSELKQTIEDLMNSKPKTPTEVQKSAAQKLVAQNKEKAALILLGIKMQLARTAG